MRACSTISTQSVGQIRTYVLLPEDEWMILGIHFTSCAQAGLSAAALSFRRTKRFDGLTTDELSHLADKALLPIGRPRRGIFHLPPSSSLRSRRMFSRFLCAAAGDSAQMSETAGLGLVCVERLGYVRGERDSGNAASRVSRRLLNARLAMRSRESRVPYAFARLSQLS